MEMHERWIKNVWKWMEMHRKCKENIALDWKCIRKALKMYRTWMRIHGKCKKCMCVKKRIENIRHNRLN